MTVAQALLLAVAGFAAGAINSVAGGGSLVSFPALLAIGTPALTANATNLIAVTPGYVGGTVGYHAELRGQGRGCGGWVRGHGGRRRRERRAAGDPCGPLRRGRAVLRPGGLRAARGAAAPDAGLLSLLVSLVAAVLLAVFGPVDWTACAIIAAASLVGGRLGVNVARRLAPQTLRYAVAGYGTIVAGSLLVT